MKNFKFKIDSNNYNVRILNHEGSNINLEVNGTSYQVQLKEEVKKVSKTPTLVRSKAQSPSEPKKINPSSNKTTVVAPIPGVVLSVKVAVGDTINVGDTLLVLEAMKMENNITSEKSGVVSKINVTNNQQVLQDQVLIELEEK
jgi:glutaconyl-CoA/methylmalonyl-CoA decarboxylase subunit gamma